LYGSLKGGKEKGGDVAGEERLGRLFIEGSFVIEAQSK